MSAADAPGRAPRRHRCGQVDARDVRHTLAVTLPRCGVTVSIALPARRCRCCGDVRVDPEMLGRARLAVACALADSGVHTGDALRHMRKSLGLRAADLAELLGVTPETVSHWETGRAQPSRAAFVAVAAMVDEETTGRTTTRDRLVRLAASGGTWPATVAATLPPAVARPLGRRASSTS